MKDHSSDYKKAKKVDLKFVLGPDLVTDEALSPLLDDLGALGGSDGHLAGGRLYLHKHRSFR